MSKCEHRRYEDWWMDYCPDCGLLGDAVGTEKRIAELEQQLASAKTLAAVYDAQLAELREAAREYMELNDYSAPEHYEEVRSKLAALLKQGGE